MWYDFSLCIMDNSEIEKVVEKTLDIRKKRLVHKFFHDPSNAESLCFILGMITLLACVGLVFTWANLDAFVDSALVDSLLGNMNCDGLKDVYKNSDLSWSQATQVKNHMLVECL